MLPKVAWHRFLRGPRSAGIPQEAELHYNTQPVRIAPVRCHELLIGGSERVQLLKSRQGIALLL